MPILLGLPYSPWSEKACWALEARHIPYARELYAPLVGELSLRRRMGKWSGPVSVPVLFDDDGRAIPDSLAIARWADTRGEGPTLVPKELDSDVVRLVEQSERALDAGRALSLHRTLKDDAALRELLPRPLRSAAGLLGPSIAAFGVRRTLRKYKSNDVEDSIHEDRLTSLLDALRAQLATRGSKPGEVTTLLGTFTFADIAMTQALTFVEPPAFGLRMGDASRRSFTHEGLRARYADLLEWRNQIYEAHRPRV